MKILTFSVTLCLISLSWAATIPVEEDSEAVPVTTVGLYNNTETEGDEEDFLSESRFLFCPPGWFRSGSRCFMYVSSPMNWISAEKYCVNQQAALVSVQNPQDYQFLQSLVKVAGRSTAWIGGFYFQGSWLWIDRAGFYYTNWATTNSVSSNQCLQMHSSNGWSNINCASALPFFCAMNPNPC